MTVYLFAGGGTAGHVNPLLATADALVAADPVAEIIVLGTAEGLESRLVPQRGYELVTTAKLPFPRGFSLAAIAFPFKFVNSVRGVLSLIRKRRVSVVVGFGGYAAAPAYVAARVAGIPIVIHEANAVPGLANRLAARTTPFVGVAFAGTPIGASELVGMPMSPAIALLNRRASRADALAHFGLDKGRPVLLVTGGSTGANRINSTIRDSIELITGAGWQVLHTVGESRDFVDPEVRFYHPIPYCDRMDLAYAAADCVVARSGAATVSELSGLAIPAVFVPYPVGNGEQVRNADQVVGAGGAILCRDAEFTPDYVHHTVVPLLRDAEHRDAMARAAEGLGIRDGAQRMVRLIQRAVNE